MWDQRFQSRGHAFQQDLRPDITQPELTTPPENVEPPGDVDRDVLKTGTTTVGVKAEGGLVLITDMRASLGNMVSSKTVQKVEQVHPTAAMTIAGSVSSAQSLIRSLRAESKLFETRRGKEMSMTALSTLLSNLLRSGAYFVVVPILGGVDDEGSHLYSLDALGGSTEEEFTVSGSGSQFALGVLENRYDGGLSMDEAEDVAIDATLAAIERDTASGNGINVAQITGDGVDIEQYEDLSQFQ